MKITIKRLSLAIAGVGMLTIYGCGGGSGGSTAATAPGDGTSVPTPSSMTVTPSLGKFSAGTQVTLTKLDGSALSTGTIGADGKVTLSLAGSTGPFLVQVLGGTSVTYYDEGTKSQQAFGIGKKLRAVVPEVLTEVGVTPLTNAATAKLEAAAGGIAGASVGTIKTANNKVAAVFGLSDILVAPKPVDGSTGNTLNLATPGDKYALILAALAKTSVSGGNAAGTADALASDLKDDKLDGQDGTTAPPTPITAYAPATLASKYQEAATESLDDSSKLLAPFQPLVITVDVTNIKPVTNQSDVSLAKAMFAELRTTLNSFANNNKTGFLNTQATRMNDDLNANVAPELTKVAERITALTKAMSAFEDAKTYTINNTHGFYSGVNPITSAPALVRVNIWDAYGTSDACWTDSATTVINKMTCAHVSSNFNGVVVFELTNTAAYQYNYTATRYNGITPVNGAPVGSGTISQTVSGTTMTGVTLNGTLPPSATQTTTGVDTVAISAARTVLTATNNYRYALSGSVSTSKLADSTKVVTLAFDSGSYIDVNETAAATTGAKLVAAKLLGTAQTAATKFTGTLDVGAFLNDMDINYAPTSIVFDGSISDISAGGAGQILTGKLEAAVANYGQYYSRQPASSTNYLHTTLTFTGTVQAPSRPLMKMVLAVNRTGLSTGAMLLNYNYGTSISITGSGVIDNAISANNTMTLSNQDGIVLAISNGANATVTKSGASLATITNGVINYIDGVTESLN